MDSMKTTAANPAIDGVLVTAKPFDLSPRHDSVLALRDPGQ
jgi:hypothetical protein